MIDPPSAHHETLYSHPMSVGPNGFAPLPPAESTTHRFRPQAYRMRPPSGDHAGVRTPSGPMSASFRPPVPAAPNVQSGPVPVAPVQPPTPRFPRRGPSGGQVAMYSPAGSSVSLRGFVPSTSMSQRSMYVIP